MDFEHKKFEKSNELFDAALKEFAEKGYEKASLNNILKVTGISKGTFYYHFKNKEDIYMYLMKLLIEEKMNFFKKNISENLFEKDFFEILEILIKLGLKFAKHNPNINKFSETFLKEKNSSVVKNIFEKLDVEMESSNFLDPYIEMSYQKKEIRMDIPKDYIKKIVNYLIVHLTDLTDVTNVEDIEIMASYLIKFIKDGIKKS